MAGPARRRLRLAFLESIKWPWPGCLYLSLPLAVILNLFFIPLWVFIFGICSYPEKNNMIIRPGVSAFAAGLAAFEPRGETSLSGGPGFRVKGERYTIWAGQSTVICSQTEKMHLISAPAPAISAYPSSHSYGRFLTGRLTTQRFY